MFAARGASPENTELPRVAVGAFDASATNPFRGRVFIEGITVADPQQHGNPRGPDRI
jgi:hypothetical protein